MIYGVYAMRDRVADYYTSFNLDMNDQSAIRNFQLAMADDSFKFRPSDFELCKLGTFDNITGKLDGALPSILCVGKEDENV